MARQPRNRKESRFQPGRSHYHGQAPVARLPGRPAHHPKPPPASVRERATLTGRKEASLSRTLKRFVAPGIIAFQDAPHRTRIPALIAHHLHFNIDLTGHPSAVAAETQA